MAEPGFWDNQEKAQKTMVEMNQLKRVVSGMSIFRNKMEDLSTLAELVDEEEPEIDGEYSNELRDTADNLFEEMEELEIASFLSGPHD
ncbi:MAG: PCRF domain-containing protein, partial [Verrucomicrobiae bacterium]|nr:PCRF domain-containing protein [Verrucomicrobiae bacterium]